jgi:hypothetical protein
MLAARVQTARGLPAARVSRRRTLVARASKVQAAGRRLCGRGAPHRGRRQDARVSGAAAAAAALTRTLAPRRRAPRRRAALRAAPHRTALAPGLSTRPLSRLPRQAQTDLAAWKGQLKAARADVEALIRSTHANPILVRLAWHDR